MIIQDDDDDDDIIGKRLLAEQAVASIYGNNGN